MRLRFAVVIVGSALLLAACQPTASGVPQATADCSAVEFPPLQSGSHLLGTTQPPVPYSSSPPTSGWHTSGAPPLGVMDEPLSEPEQVATLEAGGVVVTYSGISSQDLEALQQQVSDEFGDRVALTEYAGLSTGQIAFASWGAVQICEALDTSALADYVETYGTPVQPHG